MGTCLTGGHHQLFRQYHAGRLADHIQQDHHPILPPRRLEDGGAIGKRSVYDTNPVARWSDAFSA